MEAFIHRARERVVASRGSSLSTKMIESHWGPRDNSCAYLAVLGFRQMAFLRLYLVKRQNGLLLILHAEGLISVEDGGGGSGPRAVNLDHCRGGGGGKGRGGFRPVPEGNYSTKSRSLTGKSSAKGVQRAG